MKFKDKVVLITGASEGIGKALAIQLAQKKSKLLLLARNEEKLAELAENLNQYTEVLYHKCDVTNLNDIEVSIGKATDNFGRIDIAILNAGVGCRMKIIEFDLERTEEIIATNFFGVINFFKYLIPLFKKQNSGTIVGVSSLADVRGFPGSAAYCSSKSALTTFFESARIELKKENIKIITVRPGFVNTNMIKANEFTMKFVLEVKTASKKIIKGIEKDSNVIQFPFILSFLTYLVKALPIFLFDSLMSRGIK
ncbi:MAG: SDR family NAD(P)-dependent oxidoreductase [Ignavibacteria bacterium]|nr:SDR family NAD(P)-dependent oxidoreductase [Ignavibacteria bacterium]